MYSVPALIWTGAGVFNIALALWFRHMFLTTHGSNFRDGMRARIVERVLRDPILCAFFTDRKLFATLCVALFVFGPVFLAAACMPTKRDV